MPSAVRLGDRTTGHGCWPPTQLARASSNVIINGVGAVRLGDNIVPHCCVSCHDGVQSSASPNVILSNIQICTFSLYAILILLLSLVSQINFL